MPCSLCGTVGHNRRTCGYFTQVEIARRDRTLTANPPFMSRWRTPQDNIIITPHHTSTAAAALVETLTEVIETEEQINIETEEQINIETENNMEDNNQEEVRLRNQNERIIRTARRNLLSIMDDLEIDLLQNNDNPFITPTRSRSPSPPHSPQRPLTIQPISDSGNATATMFLRGNMPPGLTRIPSFDDIANLFNDEEFNDLPDLIPIENKNLVDCVEHPCSTDNCAICLDKLSSVDLFVTRCGHQYHGTCMIQHIKKKDNCPLCRGLLHV